MMYRIVEDSHLPEYIPEKQIKSRLGNIQLPNLKLQGRNTRQLELYPTLLFKNSIINISSSFEQYIKEIVSEIYTWNEGLLNINEKQLTTSEILEFDSIDSIKQELAERAVTALIMSNYPNIVAKFERKFHVGIHDKSAPIELFEMHHFIEIRNIIVHNDGYCSSLFLKRLENYNLESPLGVTESHSSVKIDFDYIDTIKDKIISLICHIDKQVRLKWKTSHTA